MNKQEAEQIKVELAAVTKKQRELEYKLGQYYRPIINRARNSMNKKKLMQLLDEVPDSLIKLSLYQSIREIDEIEERQAAKKQNWFDRQREVEEQRAMDGDCSILGNPSY